MKFTIRDVMWLTLVVALTVEWAVSARRMVALEARLDMLQREVQSMDRYYQRELLILGAATEFQRALSGGGTFAIPAQPSLPPLRSTPGTYIPRSDPTIPPPPPLPPSETQPVTPPQPIQPLTDHGSVVRAQLVASDGVSEQWVYTYSDGFAAYETKKRDSASKPKK